MTERVIHNFKFGDSYRISELCELFSYGCESTKWSKLTRKIRKTRIMLEERNSPQNIKYDQAIRTDLIKNTIYYLPYQKSCNVVRHKS